MIAKITRGRTFAGAARYVLGQRPGLDHDRQAEIIGGNMAGRTPVELSREFAAVRRQRPDIGQPVEHVALSFAPQDRPLTNDAMARLADDYVKRRGYEPERCQYVVVRHYDKGHQHCHILLNRVRTDRSVVPQQYREYRRNQEVCRALEREHGLHRVGSQRAIGRMGERAMTRGEDRMRRDRGTESEKEQLKAAIREAATGRPTMGEFLVRLETRGVQVRANIARTGHVSGISYRLDRVAVKGSTLGRPYSFEGLQRTLGVRFEPARDLPSLQRATHQTQGREPVWRRRRGMTSRVGRRLAGHLAARVPGLDGARLLASLARDLKQLAISPSRTAAQALSQAVLPHRGLTRLVTETLFDLTRKR